MQAISNTLSAKGSGPVPPVAVVPHDVQVLIPEVTRDNRDHYPEVLKDHLFGKIAQAVSPEIMAALELQVPQNVVPEVQKLIAGFDARCFNHEDMACYQALADHIYANRTIKSDSYDFVADMTHARDVYGNLMRAVGDRASVPAQLTALFHDIERCIVAKFSSFKDELKTLDSLRKEVLHPWNSICILHAVFKEIGILNKIPSHVLDKLYLYIMYHDANVKGFSVDGCEILPRVERGDAVCEISSIANADALDFFRPERLILFYTHAKKPVKDDEIPNRVAMCFKKLNAQGKEFAVKGLKEGYQPKSDEEACVISQALALMLV